MLNIARHARLRLGITRRDKLASTAPLLAYHEPRPGMSLNEVQVFEELAVVAMVKVPVAAALPEIARGLVELKLKVGGAVTPLGLVVRAAVRVKPPVGVTVTVEVLPVGRPLRRCRLGCLRGTSAMRCCDEFFMGIVSPIRKTCSSHFS
jgi:hypothetical protein